MPEREVLGEIEHGGTSVLDFQFPEVAENKFLFFKQPQLLRAKTTLYVSYTLSPQGQPGALTTRATL